MKLKVKGPCSVVIDCPDEAEGQTLSITIKARKSVPKASGGSIPIALQQQINFCSTAQELMALLFATPAKDEAVMAAFDRRIEELEKEDQTNNIHSLKRNNNGSTTHTATA